MTIQLSPMLDEWQTTCGWQPNAQQLQQFQNFFDLVVLANKSLNLTRILAPVDFWEKHLWDSLQPVLTRPELTGAVIDLGTGGGFPGLPIAIAQPTWAVTVMDSTAKKIRFIESGLATLALQRVQTVIDRTETLARDVQQRGKYQLVTVRAVAEAAVCAEYALPFLAVGGTALLYRGQWSDAETVHLDLVVQQLGARVVEVSEYVTPITKSLRHCIYLRQESLTPLKFPRAVGTPSQKPLTDSVLDNLPVQLRSDKGIM
jgi:16S rRNA (guanine527-N7)-methyltransferase